MIDINYNDGIKITTGNLLQIFKQDQLPLKFEIKNVVSKNVIWSIELDSNMWAHYPETEINDVVVKDKNNNFIYQYYWDVLKHGSFFYKSLWLYCKSLINKNIKPKGLVIGTHDGEFGEWVPLVRNFMSDMILIEGSEPQFNKLKSNYEGKQGITIINTLITEKGGMVEFFEGGRGYTNSVVERVIKNWEIEKISSTKKISKSINEFLTPDINWLHLDVEGLDGSLIMASNYLPKFIIFEDFNLLEEEKIKLNTFLKNKGYKLHSESGICMANKPL
jgi:hypothetical protein